jgi:iron complex transport system substrate-binding protein
VSPSSSSVHQRASTGRFAALFAALVLVLAACVGAAAPSSVSSSSAIAAATATPAATPITTPNPTPPPAFPATLTDDEKTAVKIPSEPKRIVSLTPANTEILFALAAGDRVVATDNGSDFPAIAAALPDVTSYGGAGVVVNVEQIVNLKADLVVAGGLDFTPGDAVLRLRSLGIPVLVVYASSVDGVFKDIELLGAAVGRSNEAVATTTRMRAEIKSTADLAAAAATAAGAKPRVYYEIGYTDTTGQIYAPADRSFIADLVGLAGADPITTGDPSNYEIPLERLIARDPQVIIIGVNPFYSPSPAVVSARPGWKVMTAVKDGQVRAVRDTEITRPGPRLTIGLRALTQAIWPDIKLPPAS